MTVWASSTFQPSTLALNEDFWCLGIRFTACNTVFKNVIISGLQTVHISVISSFLWIGSEVVVWFLSDPHISTKPECEGSEESGVTESLKEW